MRVLWLGWYWMLYSGMLLGCVLDVWVVLMMIVWFFVDGLLCVLVILVFVIFLLKKFNILVIINGVISVVSIINMK